MKSCTISGDLSSDSYSDQYPRETFCDACVAEDESLPEDRRRIIWVEEEDTSGSACYDCMKWPDEEAKERSEEEE
jgi:hypothetical protein